MGLQRDEYSRGGDRGTPVMLRALLLAVLFACASAGPRVLRVTSANGTLERTVFLPEDPGEGYVLVSDSSENRFEPPAGKRKLRRRRRKPHLQGNAVVNHKDPKFLNLLTIVRFDNEDCGSGGICYHEYECAQLGGEGLGPCAKGFGVCCVVEANCGETTRKPVSLFVGGGHQGACTLAVEKMECAKQIRMDFYDLELEPPVGGTCIGDRLLVSGQNSNSAVPVICGANSGQHVQVDVDESEGPLLVSVISPGKKSFRMKVSQLCDGDPALGPRGCLQYFTEPAGHIRSFNYGDNPQESSYMNNMNYAICLRKKQGMCSVEYSNVPSAGEEYPFDIKNIDLDGELTVPPGEAGAEVFNCPEDYIVIGSVRLCGQKFNDASTNADFTQNAPVVDKSNGPFMVTFVSSPTNSGKGFHLQYEQKPCL